MRHGIRSELIKLTSTRSSWGILLGAAAISVAAFLAPGENAVGELAKPLHEQQAMFFTGFLLRVLLLVLGVRAMTDEWRHGTLTPSLLVTPRRARFIVVKTVSTALFGGVVTVVATALTLLTATVYAQMNGVTLGPVEVFPIAGLALSGALWAAIGVGLGAIVKSQLLATVSGLIWLMAIDDMLRERLGDLAGYLPGQAGLALVIAPDGRVWLRSSTTLVAYAVALVAVGAILTRRRDVT